MKTIITVLIAAIVLVSCTRQAEQQSAPETEVATKKGKSAIEAAVLVTTNPAPNTIEWTLPDDQPGKALVYTYINWAPLNHNYLEQGGGVQIPQFGVSPSVTQFVNSGQIPPGTWSILITHYVATTNPSGGWNYSEVDPPYLAPWLDNVTFD